MMALSVCQPWAWLIVSGHKAIENRTWPTRHRGPLLIHASKSQTYAGAWSELAVDVPELPEWNKLVFGAVVGKVRLVDVRSFSDVRGRRWAEGPFCWMLEDPQAFERPVPFSGKLKLFPVPPEIMAGVS